MALATATITFDVADLLGVDFDARRIKAWTTTNADNNRLIDTAANKVRMGDGVATVAADGTGSFSVWVPGPDGNPTSWQQSFWFDYPLPGGRGREKRMFGPYTITGDADLADLEQEQAIPPTYLGQVAGALSDYVDDAQDARAGAESARTGAEAARDEAIDISGISTSDDVVEALVNPGAAGPKTKAALSASYAAESLVFYDEFSRYADGPINGQTPAYGGIPWLGTGAAPEVEDGFLITDSTGYAWQELAAPADEYVVEFQWDGSGADSSSLTLATSNTFNSIANLLHPSFSAEGFDVKFRQGDVFSIPGTNQVRAGGSWVKRLVNGETYRIGVQVDGDTLQIAGPHGESFTVTDPRVGLLHGRFFFVEPTTTGFRSKISRVMVFNREESFERANKPSQLTPTASAGLIFDDYSRVVSNRYTVWEVTIGRIPADNTAGVIMGPHSLVTTLTTAVTAGGTTLTTREPLLNGLTLIIEPGGANEETVTTSSDAGGTGPFTVTIGALGHSHPVGTTVLCATVPDSKRIVDKWQPGNARTITGAVIVPSPLYFPGFTANLSQGVAGQVVVSGFAPGKGGFKVASVATSADLPLAGFVGAGTIYFVADIAKYVGSNGTTYDQLS